MSLRCRDVPVPDLGKRTFTGMCSANLTSRSISHYGQTNFERRQTLMALRHCQYATKDCGGSSPAWTCLNKSG